MLFRIKRRLAYWRYQRLVGGIEETPPLTIVDSPLRIVSQVAVPWDVRMYLVAAKTFYRRIGHGRFVIIPDRTLPRETADLIRRHLDGAVEFLPLADIDVGRCQRGGTWERLLTCLDLATRHYVVQLDCDTLAMGDLREVREAIASNRPFALAEGAPLRSFAETGRLARRRPEELRHIVDVAEAALADHPEAERWRYVRASSAFAGFAPGSIGRNEIESFHEIMHALVGRDRWRQWGSEQVASNVAVANGPDPVLLPFPDYANITPSIELARVRFGHFLGTYRFQNQMLARASLPLIEGMRRGDALPSAA